jgi:hypothetical protein
MFVATQQFVSNRSNSGRAADIEPTLMTEISKLALQLGHGTICVPRIRGISLDEKSLMEGTRFDNSYLIMQAFK